MIKMIAWCVLFSVAGNAVAQELQCELNERRIAKAIQNAVRQAQGELVIARVEEHKTPNTRCEVLQHVASVILERRLDCRGAVRFFNEVPLDRLPLRAKRKKCLGKIDVYGFLGDERFHRSKLVYGRWTAVGPSDPVLE